MKPESTEGTYAFSVDPARFVRRLFLVALTCEAGFVLADLFINYARPRGSGPIRRLFNITREDALPSWFASTQTFLIGLTLVAVWVLARRAGASKWRRRGWGGLALFFFYMAVDDGAKVHERLGSSLGDLFESPTGATWLSRVMHAFPSYNWQLFVLPLFLIVGVWMFFFLWRELPERRDRVLLLTAMACLAVAVGLDFVEGLDEEHSWNLHAALDRGLGWSEFTERRFDKSGYAAVVHFSKSVEEFLEMLANTLLWVVFLRQIAARGRELRLRIGT